MIKNMKEVFSNEEFVKALFAMETVEEMQAALQEKDVALSEEEIKGIHGFFAKVKSGEITREQLEKLAAQAENGELSEEMLEQVAGGGFIILGLVGLGISLFGFGGLIAAEAALA